MTEVFVEEALPEVTEVKLDQDGGEVSWVTILPAVQQIAVGRVLLPDPADFVEPVNTAPTAADGAATTQEDQPVTIDLGGFVSDADGDALTITKVSSASDDPSTPGIVESPNGFLSLDGSEVVYTPDADFFGVDEFEFTVSDGEDTAQGSVTVTVEAANDAPDAVDDAATTDEDQSVTIDALSNDSDVEGNALTIQSVTQPASGSVAIVANELVYTPAANAHGSYSFTYTASDGQGGSDTATVSVTVAPINDAPVAVDDSFATPFETSLVIGVSELTSDDTDLDGDSLSVVSVSAPMGGAVTLAGSSVTFVPDQGFSGVGSFSYTIADGNGGTDSGSVSVSVGANAAPLATDDTATTSEDLAITVPVISNDTDLDGDSLSITSLGAPANGSVINNGNGTVTYTPNTNFHGVDSFTYEISDGNGGTDTGSVTVTIAAVNDAPVAVGDATTTNEDTAVAINLIANDTDLDGDSLSIASLGAASHGTVVDNGNGTVTYTPAANYHGADAFTYTVTDSNGGTDTASVSIVVNPVNDDPAATDDSDSTNEDHSVTVDVTGNDSDADGDDVSIQSVTQGTFGTVAIDAGQITYTPNADASGQDSFTYTVFDGQGGTSTATVTIDVIPVNDAPVAVSDSFVTPFEAAIDIATSALVANDTDKEGDALTVTGVGNATGGTVALSGGTVTFTPADGHTGAASFEYTLDDGFGGTATGTVNISVGSNTPPVANDDATSTSEDAPVSIAVVTNDSDLDGDSLSVTALGAASHGSLVDNGNGTITYTPNANYNGQDTFTYTVADGKGGSATATVTVSVTATNDVPVAANDAVTTNEDTAVMINLLVNDTDIDGDTISVSSVGAASNGSVVNNGDGTATYTPNTNYNGADSFTYQISDGNGGTASATVNITVTSVNDAPVGTDDIASGEQDNAITIDVLANDSDVENDVLVLDVSVSNPSNGTVSIFEGKIVYTPNAGYVGQDSFDYIVSDGDKTSVARVTVDVTAASSGGGGGGLDPINPAAFQLTSGDDDGAALATDGQEIIDGLAGNDTLHGGSGGDSLYGNIGDDVLHGGSSGDQLFGGSGDDTIFGDNNDDTMDGGAGSDTLTGGKGKDTYKFTVIDGQVDTVTDYAWWNYIDIAGALVGYVKGTSNLSNFVRFTTQGSDTLMEINTDGGAAGWVQVAIFKNVTNLAGTEVTMETDGKLIT